MNSLKKTNLKYDVIVVGAGHAGCEAALACARLGHPTLLLTINIDGVARMSCNPAVGGLGKGHLVKEIDALGGEMAKNIDDTGIQFRQLNTKKGPAVRSSRAQGDLHLYHLRMKKVLERQKNLFLKQAIVDEIIVENRNIVGVETNTGEKLMAHAVILTAGTFLRGLVHIGLKNFAAGRLGDLPSMMLSESLARLGFALGRLKTGTCPRLDGKSINFSLLNEQWGDDPPKPFSFSNKKVVLNQVPCHITYTNKRTHQIIRSGLDRSPLYCGVIKGVGPRYCPSVEDKVMRFPEKDQHQIFLEPMGLETLEIYPNGLSTSLPMDIQLEMLHSIQGLEKVEIIRPGYWWPSKPIPTSRRPRTSATSRRRSRGRRTGSPWERQEVQRDCPGLQHEAPRASRPSSSRASSARGSPRRLTSRPWPGPRRRRKSSSKFCSRIVFGHRVSGGFAACRPCREGLGQSADVPRSPDRWVTDKAGFLSAATVDELDSRLETFERTTGHQIIVYIDKTTGGTPLEDWASRCSKPGRSAAKAWMTAWLSSSWPRIGRCA